MTTVRNMLSKNVRFRHYDSPPNYKDTPYCKLLTVAISIGDSEIVGVRSVVCLPTALCNASARNSKENGVPANATRGSHTQIPRRLHSNVSLEDVANMLFRAIQTSQNQPYTRTFIDKPPGSNIPVVHPKPCSTSEQQYPMKDQENRYSMPVQRGTREPEVAEGNVLNPLSGKLSQTTQSLHVRRSSARTFEREQWEASYYVEGGPSECAGGYY
ncbi:hypothetical protein EV424DRAFT_1600706 [Suillus variegatus]|nr:hypothetical protein EV424DRAFT_1600706 [Suillus variegatus]